MVRSYRYPLHPTKAQAATFNVWLAALCNLHNAALQERRDAYRLQRVTITKFGQYKSLTDIRKADQEIEHVPIHVARGALTRLDKAMHNFHRRVKENKANGTKKPCGFPRFKPKHRYDSFSVGQGAAVAHRRGTLIQGRHVHIPKLGLVRFNQYRPIPPGASVLDVVVRRELGEWFVIFQVDLGAAPAKPDVTTIPAARQVGIDVGLTTLVTLSTGEPIENPRHGRDGAEVLAQRQRALARKKRGSKSRRRARLLVQKAYAAIANRRKDTAYKVAASLVERFDMICYEDLNIAGMARGLFGKSIHDAGWGVLLRAVENKAESAGAHAVAAPSAGTTIECSACGARVPKTLAERVHRCPCGLVLCRDLNAAINVLARGRRVVGLPALRLVTPEGGHYSAPLLSSDPHCPM